MAYREAAATHWLECRRVKYENANCLRYILELRFAYVSTSSVSFPFICW